MTQHTPILLVSLALSVSAGVGCNRNAASKTNEGGEELIEQTSPIAKTGDGEGAKSEEDGPERFEALFTTWSVAPEALEELEGTCDVAPISQLARPVVCWSSIRSCREGFLLLPCSLRRLLPTPPHGSGHTPAMLAPST